jgi:hypothetical protein
MKDLISLKKQLKLLMSIINNSNYQEIRKCKKV